MPIFIYFILISFLLQSNVVAAPKFCWKDSYGRGAGTIPGQPPKGQFRHWFSAHWYSCPKGYDRSLNPNILATDACIKNIPAKPTKYYSAKFAGKVHKSKPSGSFLDPRKGGEYWSCPKGYNRSLAPVTAKNACSKRIGESLKAAKFLKSYKRKKPSGSFYDPRNGGEYWSCGGWKRSWSAVTASDACVQGGWFSKTKRATFKGKVHNSKPSGSFYDPRKGGEYWTCQGWNRTAYAVTSSKACSKAGYEKISKAKFISKAKNVKPGGAFFDPRNGGEFWSCQQGTNRTVLHAVNSSKACEKVYSAKTFKSVAKRHGSVCGKKEEQAGLCYNRCKKGYDAVGPVCWIKKAPVKKWVDCGAGYAKDDATCAMVIGSQVAAAVEVAAFIFSAGTSATASTSAKALKAHKQMVKMSKAKRWAELNKKKAAILKGFNQAKKAGQNVAAYGSSLSNLNAATTEEDLIRAAADIASLQDPSGVSSAVAAYTFAKCSKYKNKGSFEAKTVLEKISSKTKASSEAKISSKTKTLKNTKAASKSKSSSSKLNWKRIPGSLTDIGVGANGVVWGTNRNGKIYRLNPNQKSWENIPGSAVRIDVGPKGNAVAVNSKGAIYKYDGKRWKRIPGSLTDIGFGADGSIWGFNKNGDIYRLKSDQKSWLKFPRMPGHPPAHIDVGPRGNAVVVNKKGNIYFWLRNKWKRITTKNFSGTLKEIGVGGKGIIWGVNNKDEIFKLVGRAWKKFSGALKVIDVGPNGKPWGVNSKGEIYKGS